MTITSRGVPLSSIFGAKGTATAPNTGLTDGGVELAQLYLALSQGVPVPATGISVGNPPADLNTFFGKPGAIAIPFGNYSAFSSDSHDCGAGLTLTFFPNGTWTITMYALHGGTTSGTPLSGNWVSNPGAGIGSSYEMLLDSSHMGISNGYNPPDQVSPFFTGSTGWVNMGSNRVVQADTSHMIAGGAGSGSIQVAGYFNVYIRPAGSGGGTLSQVSVSVEGDAF